MYCTYGPADLCSFSALASREAGITLVCGFVCWFTWELGRTTAFLLAELYFIRFVPYGVVGYFRASL